MLEVVAVDVVPPHAVTVEQVVEQELVPLLAAQDTVHCGTLEALHEVVVVVAKAVISQPEIVEVEVVHVWIVSLANPVMVGKHLTYSSSVVVVRVHEDVDELEEPELDWLGLESLLGGFGSGGGGSSFGINSSRMEVMSLSVGILIFPSINSLRSRVHFRCRRIS